MPEHPPHGERYERAREYLDVITRLWDSWEDDAVINDPASGIFADTDKIHKIDHVGKHFWVRGPLNVSRPPQGRPVYVQAGSSDDGRAFAARFAEAIFTAHQTLASAQEFYTDIKRQAKAFDRHTDQINTRQFCVSACYSRAAALMRRRSPTQRSNKVERAA